MADYDVVVVGGGPAGYAAALRAAEEGASVALVEAEQPGGTCVHHACIPTNILMGAADSFVEAREMDVLGVFSAGEQFNFGRAAARKDTLVRQMAAGIHTALRMGRVALVEGRATFTSPAALDVTLSKGGNDSLSAESFIIATGTRWEKPEIAGVAANRILTADEVQSLALAPASAVVLGDGAGQTAFGLEYATLLAAAGSEVALVTSRANPLPGLDEQVVEMVRAALADLGIRIVTSTSIERGDEQSITVRDGAETVTLPAEIVVAADVRRPFVESVNPGAAGVNAAGQLDVDRACRTSVGHIFGAGDVTGGAMLSSAATHMGEVAAINATGGNAVTRLALLPHVFHTIPEVGWVGISERAAREAGHDVTTGMADLSHTARAVVLGARQGIVKVVAERELGAVLGVHAIGPEAREIIAVAAALMQAEVTLADMAATIQWHPAMSEGLAQAARRAL